MKRVVSVSIGSSKRNHRVRHRFLDTDVDIERIGTDGDLDRAEALCRTYDGEVDAIGIGGIEFYLQVADRRYYFRDAKRLARAIRTTPVGDGNGIKTIVAQRAVAALDKHLRAQGRTLAGMRAFHVVAVDRYGMAKALVDAGCDTFFGDLPFSLGVPKALGSLRQTRILARALLPVVTQLPFRWLYSQNQYGEIDGKWSHYYDRATLISGDFLQVRSSMPPRMDGKIILTNTTTEEDVETLRRAGVHLLVTTTPRLGGRSFGTNVMEATLLALMGNQARHPRPEDFRRLIEAIPLSPCITELNALG
ncbi:MAG: hypothetical protein KC416_03380 [Myxococcales bacterium]|nr:hypothetical protein [Myxococcales bacterium]